MSSARRFLLGAICVLQGCSQFSTDPGLPEVDLNEFIADLSELEDARINGECSTINLILNDVQTFAVRLSPHDSVSAVRSILLASSGGGRPASGVHPMSALGDPAGGVQSQAQLRYGRGTTSFQLIDGMAELHFQDDVLGGTFTAKYRWLNTELGVRGRFRCDVSSSHVLRSLMGPEP